MKYKILLILIIFLIIVLSGCINNQKNDNNKNDLNDEIYFLLTYSTESDIEENVTIIIKKGSTEILNQTLKPERGYEIYREKANGEEYNVKAIWNNRTSELSFKPKGNNTLFLIIRNNELRLSEYHYEV